MLVSAVAPTRVDLAGGTLDIAPLHQLLPRACTVNFGITVYAEADVRASDTFRFVSEDLKLSEEGSFAQVTQSTQLPLLGLLLKSAWNEDLPPVEIKTRSQSPAGAGLGGSSCLAVAIYRALLTIRGELEGASCELSDDSLVKTVQDVEIPVIHAPTGCQDYWGGVRGNVNIIRFPTGRTEVETLSPSHLAGLAEELIIVYSGKSRASARNNWEIFKRAFEGDKTVLRTLAKIAETTNALADEVRGGRLRQVLSLSRQEWQLRTSLWADIESGETQRIDEAARRSGAHFTRVCGAGGGGVMAVFAEPDRRDQVMQAVEKAGGRVLRATVANHGCRVTKR